MPSKRRCAVASCRPPYITESFHHFPKDPGKLDIWVKYCRRADEFDPNKSMMCSRHFHPEAFVRDMRFELLGGRGKPKSILKPESDPDPSLRDVKPGESPEPSARQ